MNSSSIIHLPFFYINHTGFATLKTTATISDPKPPRGPTNTWRATRSRHLAGQFSRLPFFGPLSVVSFTNQQVLSSSKKIHNDETNIQKFQSTTVFPHQKTQLTAFERLQHPFHLSFKSMFLKWAYWKVHSIGDRQRNHLMGQRSNRPRIRPRKKHYGTWR